MAAASARVRERETSRLAARRQREARAKKAQPSFVAPLFSVWNPCGGEAAPESQTAFAELAKLY